MEWIMNERIKELAKRAGGQGLVVKDFIDTEKFAMLIIQECADIAKHHVMNISTYGDAEFVDEQIKDHFGVK
jgi:hypothetical protein